MFRFSLFLLLVIWHAMLLIWHHSYNLPVTVNEVTQYQYCLGPYLFGTCNSNNNFRRYMTHIEMFVEVDNSKPYTLIDPNWQHPHITLTFLVLNVWKTYIISPHQITKWSTMEQMCWKYHSLPLKTAKSFQVLNNIHSQEIKEHPIFIVNNTAAGDLTLSRTRA